MKKLLFLIFIPLTLGAQRMALIEKWELKTENNYTIIGASKDYNQAIIDIEDFKKRNENTKYRPIPKSDYIISQMVGIKKRGDNPLGDLNNNTDKFNKYTEKRKSYFVLSELESAIFSKYNWTYHPDIVLFYDSEKNIGFSAAKLKVLAIIKYKIND